MALLEETLFGSHDKVAIALQRLRTFEPPEGNGYLVMGTEEGFLQKSHISSSLSVPVHPGWE